MKAKRLRMRTRIAILVSIIVFLSGVTGASIMVNRMRQVYELELGKRVMAIGQSLAQSPIISQELKSDDGWKTIQPIAERVRLVTDVEYVIIFNMEKRRYSHPLEERIGTIFTGGDEGLALTEQSYISKAKGVKGIAIRSFVPVMDEEGSRQVGVVVVGVLAPTFLQILMDFRFDLYLSLIIGITFGIIGAIWVSRRIKQQMFNMEPMDIAHLFEEREKVIESIEEGIIAIDYNQRITVFNSQAGKIMGIPQNVIGKPILEVIPNSHLPEVLKDGKPQYHHQRKIHDKVIITNRVPIIVNGKILGAMSTFQDRTEVVQLAEQFTGVRKFIDALRAQNHEYLNKLHTIAGLVQLQRYDEVVEKIIRFNQEKEEETNYLIDRIKDYTLSGLILGKISHAKEQGVELQVTSETFFQTLPANVKEADLLLILGNLLENAIYAASRADKPNKQVSLYLEGNEDGIEIEVIDNGIGMTEEVKAKVFKYGYTTKGDQGQGIGLFLVKQLVHLLGGEIHVDSKSGEGARFTVIIPGPIWEIEEDRNGIDTDGNRRG